ncbi:hypothetical protein GCM10023147_36470 [Tsukamurella soli]|uniref:Beta-lactamase class A catalytic domain-containing protein n=2 Tax=Tsukamurella soli TaxID=644556 RepID=A0ABP8K1K5_9ACTN
MAVARREGVTVSIAVVDRATGAQGQSANAHTGFLTASVVKVMIADDVLTQRDAGKLTLSPSDLATMRLMITRSDDDAADHFWSIGGGDPIVTRIARRYGLHDTRPPKDQWWDTTTSAADLVSLYSQIVSGTHTAPDVRDFIVGAMRGFQPTGTDGEHQTFGLPTALANERIVGYKQGWMPLADGEWVHNSTAIVGGDNRYIVAMMAHQPAPKGEGPTVTALDRVAEALFPGGRIGTPAGARSGSPAPVATEATAPLTTPASPKPASTQPAIPRPAAVRPTAVERLFES